MLAISLQSLAQKAEVKEVTGKRIEVTSALDSQISTEVKALLAPYKPGVDSLIAPVLGVSAQYMTGGYPESLLGNLLCDALMEVSPRYGKKADLAILNRGGLRSAMPQGEVRVGDIIEIAPFENVYTLVEMRGDVLLELMEQIAQRGGECVSREVRMIAENLHLKSLTIKGKAVNPKKTYSIATIDYLAEGNDGMPAFKKGKVKKTQHVVREVYMDWIRSKTRKGEVLTSQLDGRIVLEGMTEADQAKPKKQTLRLSVVHTNDTHSCIMPYNPNASDKAYANKGGFLRRTVVVDSLRNADPEMLLFDCGDFSQGSAYYNLYRGDVEADMMNHMRYDACTIGNHEFDFGIDNMARLFRRLNFPVVNCNYDFRGTPLEGIVEPYTILKRKGLKIGVVGVGAELDGLVSQKNSTGVKFLNPLTEADRVARQLKEQEHCDLVICLSHLGVIAEDKYNDQKLVAQSHYIDAVLGGHSHTAFTKVRMLKNADGRDIPISQQGKNARFVGVMDFDIEVNE